MIDGEGGPVMRTAKVVSFDGPCPFLTCFFDGPHTHACCPDCDAVRFGNLGCPTCRAQFRAPTEGP